MINPSAIGWIDKFFVELDPKSQPILDNERSFYENTRTTGFLFGYTTHIVTDKTINTKSWTTEEFSKIALLNTLFGVFQLVEHSNKPEDFIPVCVQFYKKLHPQDSLLNKLLPQDSFSNKLEKIISARVQTNDNIISKNFSHILTNALLFIDVLAFKKYLLLGEIPDKYLKKTEEIIVNIVSLSLKNKSIKSKYDDLLEKLFESSVRYTKYSKLETVSIDDIDLSYFDDDYEKYYLVDLAGMAVWNDEKLESSEVDFLNRLTVKLKLPLLFAQKSMKDMDEFLKNNKSSIPYFNFSNPVKHFYDHTTHSIQTLLTRNKNRLQVEISQSKELMILLAKSTQRDLDAEEKKKVKNQLLDICKTIPSLTIFLLPGGSLLLPILIKFIPKMLPSAFNENLHRE